MDNNYYNNMNQQNTNTANNISSGYQHTAQQTEAAITQMGLISRIRPIRTTTAATIRTSSQPEVRHRRSRKRNPDLVQHLANVPQQLWYLAW